MRTPRRTRLTAPPAPIFTFFIFEATMHSENGHEDRAVGKRFRGIVSHVEAIVGFCTDGKILV